MGNATFGRMNVHDNILGTIGNTPMVRLNAIAEEFPCPIWAKPKVAATMAWVSPRVNKAEP